MKKIKTLFVRDETDRRYITDVVEPGLEWVLAGEGMPTRKLDGTCVMLDDHGVWWARREVKPGKPTPPGFVPLGEDGFTHKVMGYEPIGQSSWATWHAEAVRNSGPRFEPGTYELCGPRINGNPEGFGAHVLIRHGWAPLSEREDLVSSPRDFEGLRKWLGDRNYEGIVWHRNYGDPDTDMCKVKKRDFRQ